MGNSLRCCLACVIPCGALDMIRIVHLNGQVEEITRPCISAGEVLNANPNYVLSKPAATTSSDQAVVQRRRILILSPDSDLKRGNIYFLIPASSLLDKKRNISNRNHNNNNSSNSNTNIYKKKKKKKIDISTTTTTNITDVVLPAADSCQGYFTETHSEKKSSRRHRRRANRASQDWRPHLQSITEADSKHFSSVVEL